MDGQTGQLHGRPTHQENAQSKGQASGKLCESCEGSGIVSFSEREVKQLIRDMLSRNSAVLFSDFRTLLTEQSSVCPICQGSGFITPAEDSPRQDKRRRH